MPREYGKAEPWNFICRSKVERKKVEDLGEEIHD